MSRVALIVLLTLVAALVAAPAALARFNVQKLRLGSASGAEDYLYTSGNTVVEQATVDSGRYYRFDVYDPSGTVRLTSACRPSTSNGGVTGSYILQSGDPLSNTTAWRFRLREFASASTCSSASSAQRDDSLYFDVAAASSYSSSALTSKQSSLSAASSAYVQVAGAGKIKTNASNTAQGVGSWTTSWILPSGATACANTKNNASDLPGSTAAGQLPDRTLAPSPGAPNLQYRPSLTSSFDAWNLESNYETRPCQSFASANEGQWSLKLARDGTHFVTLPVFTVDATAPDTTITSGPSGVIGSTSAAFQFVSSDVGSTFQCSLDGSSYKTCSSPQTYTSLAAGAHTFSVQAVDAAGNVDPTPATSSWTVDTTAPNVTLTSPAAGSYTNNTIPTLAGTAETPTGASPVTVKIFAGTSISGSPVQSLTVAVQSAGTWAVNASTLADGTYTAQAQQTDAANNTGYSYQVTFTVLTVPPTVTLSAPASGTHTNDTTPYISGTAGTAPIDLRSVTVTITGGASPVQATASVAPDGTWAIDLPQSLPDGNYTVQASQHDQAGNTGYSYSHALTIDTTPPQTSLDAAPVGTTSSTTATISFHAVDALSQAGSTFLCQLDGSAWSPCSSPISYYNLSPGSHTFSVEAIDGAGNVDTTGRTATWTINTSLPAITLESPADGSYTNNTTPTFSGTAGTAAGDASSVQVLVYSNTNLSGSPVQTLHATAASDGSWSAMASPLPDGTYVVFAQQSGAAGTATSDVHTFTVVTQPPTTTITLGPPGNSGTGVASFSFSSSERGSTFQCQLDGGGWTSCASPQYYSGLGNGPHTFQVRAIDLAGNVGAPASQTWSVNTNLPALSLSSPGDGTATNNQTPAISGTGGTASGDASTVTVNIYSGTTIVGTPVQTIVTTVSSSTGSWSAHPSPALPEGTYTVYAQQNGSAGTAYTSASTFTVDTTSPTTTIASAPQGITSATSARFTFTSSEASSTFQCQLDASAWTACTSPQSYSSLAVGTHTFNVRAIDPAGNVDPNAASATWTIDSAANVPVTLTAPADGTVTNDVTPTFSGAGEVTGGPISVEVDDVGGNPVETLTTAAGSSWSATASPALPDGTYTAFAYQLSSDGTTTYDSAVIDFTIDTIPPAVTLTSAPTGPTNNQTPTFGGAVGSAGGDFGVVAVKVYSGTSASGTPLQTLSASVSGGSWSATASKLSEGTYTVRAEQSDSAGNTGSSAKRTFTVDTTPPTVTVANPAAGSSANDATPTVSGSAEAASADSNVTVKVFAGSAATGSPVQSLTASVQSDGSWTTTASTLADGTYTAQAQQTDAANNIGTSAPHTFTIDTTPPAVTLTSGPTGASSNQTPTFSGAGGTAAGDLGVVAVEIYSGASASGTPVQTLSASVSGGSWSATASRLADGRYTVRAKQSDAPGNTGYSAQRTFTVDTTPPAVTLTTPAGGSYTNHTTPAVSGTAEMASGDSNVTVKIFAGSVATGTPVQSLSATAQLDGTWTVNASTLAEGTYTARAQQSDAANNTGTSAAHTFTIDTTPPHTSIISGPSASSTATSATFSFTASETGSTFECRLDGSAWKSCTSPAAYAALAVGKHTFDVRATDLAGNTEPIPATSSWTVTAPSPGTTPPPTTTTPPTAATLRVTLTANSKQRLARRRKLSVQVRCTGACSLFLSGKLSLVAKPKHAAGRTRRALVLNRMLAIKLPAAKSVKVTLKLPAKVRAAITAALARHARVTLTLSALASAPGVKSANARVTIRLLR